MRETRDELVERLDRAGVEAVGRAGGVPVGLLSAVEGRRGVMTGVGARDWRREWFRGTPWGAVAAGVAVMVGGVWLSADRGGVMTGGGGVVVDGRPTVLALWRGIGERGGVEGVMETWGSGGGEVGMRVLDARLGEVPE